MPKHIAIGISFRPHDQHANAQYDSRIKMMTIWFTNKDRRQIFPRDINFEIFRRGQFLVVKDTFHQVSFLERNSWSPVSALSLNSRWSFIIIQISHSCSTSLSLHAWQCIAIIIKKKKKHNVTGFSITYVTHTSIFARRGEGKRKGRNP